MSPQNRLIKDILDTTANMQDRIVEKAEKLKAETNHLWQKALDVIHPDNECEDAIKKDRETRDGRRN